MSLLSAMVGVLLGLSGQLDSGPVQLQYESQLLKAPVPSAGKLFGDTILVADVDADGFGDVIAIERRANLPGVQQAGIAWIVSVRRPRERAVDLAAHPAIVWPWQRPITASGHLGT